MFATTPYICRDVSMSPVSQSTKRMNVPTRIIPGRRKPCIARTMTRMMKNRESVLVVRV
jgi:hypothetical protein